MPDVPLGQLFKPLNNPKDIQEALTQIAADFTAAKVPVYQQKRDGSYEQVPHYALVQNDDSEHPLSIMRANYGLVQYGTALDFLSECVSNGTAEFHSARLTDGGARLHVVMKASKFVEIAPGDSIECYFTVSTTHDGSGKITAMCTPIHDRTQTVFTPLGDGIVSVKHTAKAQQNLARARFTINKMHEFFDKYIENFKLFAGTKVSDQQARDYFLMLEDGDSQRASNIRDRLFDIRKMNRAIRGSTATRDTLFGCLMASMVYADAYKTVRTSKLRSEDDAKLESRLTGAGATMKAEAYATCLHLERMWADDEDE
jgi:phage/plasmid-like protein (TIGR03299 family)